MDFAFSEEQELLRGQARDFLDKVSPSKEVRRLMESDPGHDPAIYGRMAELGWTAIPFEESRGGLGLGLVDLTVVLEELGRHLTASPLQSSVCLAGMTLRSAGGPQAERLLPGIASGEKRVTVALLEASGRWDASGVEMRAEPSQGAYLLRGEKLYVPDAHVADTIVVAVRTGAAQDGDGITLLAVDAHTPGVELRRLRTMDATQRLFAVGFDAVEVPVENVVGAPGRGWAALQHGLDAAAVAVSAELCGVAERVLEMSVEYAKTRRQFGRPIGSYQGVSHKCADMLVQVESAKSLTYHAAWALDSDVPEAPLAAAMAKAYASDAARAVTAQGIQVHGGIGFTWEHDAHLYFKRAKWGEVVYGDARFHRERVAQLLEL